MCSPFAFPFVQIPRLRFSRHLACLRLLPGTRLVALELAQLNQKLSFSYGQMVMQRLNVQSGGSFGAIS